MDNCNSKYNNNVIEQYEVFKKKYHVILDKQQEDAIRNVNGASLLLAIPGSGKTTTLIARIAHMTLVMGVDPSKILAITYTVKATDEMRSRFCKQYDEEKGEKIDFRTINSLAHDIICSANRKGGKLSTSVIQDNKKILADVYKKINPEEYPTEYDLIEMQTFLSFVKNMLIPRTEFIKMGLNIKDPVKVFDLYNNELKKQGYIDYDDQLVNAYTLLKKYEDIKNEFAVKYDYVIVDEAQDTSRVQHEIIKLITAKHNNVFMVGDEDQSIFGFRGAYPQALLEFRETYKYSRVQKLETNYRSNKEIVDISKRFIDKNKDRIKKNMSSYRGEGGSVNVIPVPGREDQFLALAQECRNKNDVAILYRNNDTAIPLIDIFDREGIPFRLNRINEKTFFTNRILNDVKDMLAFVSNSNDTEAFMRLYYKIGLGLRKEMVYYAVKSFNQHQTDFLEELKDQKTYAKRRVKNNIDDFCAAIKMLKKKSTVEIIDYFCRTGYTDYVSQNALGGDKIYLIRMIAEREPTIDGFFKRIDTLSNLIQRKSDDKDNNEQIVLSTIHSAKGMEFNTVYVLDALDGILPSSGSVIKKNDGQYKEYEEERRLFYVAITRAKNELNLFSVWGSTSEFVNEIKQPIAHNKQNDTEKKLRQGVKTNEPSDAQNSRQLISVDTSHIKVGKKVGHKHFGLGFIVKVTNEIVEINFSGSVKKFKNPDAFEQGFLILASE